jgi:hypothetical protein
VSALCTCAAREAQDYDDEKQLWLDLDPGGEDALLQLQGASLRYRIGVGPIVGRKTLRLHTPGAARERAQQSKPFTVARDGFLLNATVAKLKARERRKLERPKICASRSSPLSRLVTGTACPAIGLHRNRCPAWTGIRT